MAPKSILTQREVAEALRSYKHLLKKKGVPLTALYLFGSYAKKRQRPWSDIDVAVVSPRFGKDFVRESVFVNRLADDINPLLQAHPLHTSAINDTYSTLTQEIKKYGKKV